MHKVTTAALAGVLLAPAVTSTAASRLRPALRSSPRTTGRRSTWPTAGRQRPRLRRAGDRERAVLRHRSRDPRRAHAPRRRRPSQRYRACRRASRAAVPARSSRCTRARTCTGNSLSFVSTGGWTNLAPYGFDNKLESWVNQTACNATVADGTLGSGAQLTLAARSSAATVGTSWKDRASSINVLPSSAAGPRSRDKSEISSATHEIPSGIPDTSLSERCDRDLDAPSAARRVGTTPGQPVSSVAPSVPMTGRRVRLRAVLASDYEFLFQLAVDERTAPHWRYRGAPPRPEAFIGELWDGVLTQFIVERKDQRERLGLVTAYERPRPRRTLPYRGDLPALTPAFGRSSRCSCS